MSDQRTPRTKQRSENVVPVTIQDILNNKEEYFTVEGVAVGMVIVYGEIEEINISAAKTILVIKDKSGKIEVIKYSAEETHKKGNQVKIIGTVRSGGDEANENKHIFAFKIQTITTKVEKDAHLLDVVFSRLKIKQLQAQQNEAIGTEGLSNSMMEGSFSQIGSQAMGSVTDQFFGNSMMGGGFSQTGSQTMGSVANQPFGNTNHDLVYRCIEKNMEDAGLHKDQLFAQIKANMSKSQIETSLKFLSDEGYIYESIDEDHFKSTYGE